MIIITGPGRSGTSVLAQFCLKMGHNPGGSWYDCVDAGLEHPRVAAINDALFLEAMRTGTVKQTLDAHRAEMRALDLTVVKDPRFTFHPAILRAWHSVRSDIKVLMTYRTPEHSVASRKRHGRDLIHKEKSRPDVLRCDFANVIEAMLDLEIPFSIVLFPNFLTRYEHVSEAFETLGMQFDHAAGQDVWNTLVNMEKVHFRPAGSMQAAKAVAAPPRREAWWNPVVRLPRMPSRIHPLLGLSLLLGLICVPLGWKTLGASAVSLDQNQQTSLRPVGRLAPLSLFLTPHLVRHWSGSGPFDTAFLQGLSAYSVQRFPFETTHPARTLRHRGMRPMGHPMG